MDIKKCLAWGFYDWASSIWPTIVNAFVISAYFATSVASSPEQGAILWGYQASIVGLVLAVLAPLLGAVIDQNRNEKRIIAVFTMMCILCSSLLWFAYPKVGYQYYILVIVGLGSVFNELAFVPYNTLLGRVFPPNDWAKVSAWGFSLGYVGGILALSLSLFGLVLNPEWLGFEVESAEQIRILGPIMAIWMGVFSLPLLGFVKAPSLHNHSLLSCLRRGIGDLKRTFVNVKKHRRIARFLLAHMFYMDGLTTVFAFAGIYAANIFGMSLQDVMIFGIASQVFAGLGAWVYGWVEQMIGVSRSLLIVLVLFLIMGLAIICVQDVVYFYVFGLGCSMLIGPIQSSSRTLMTHLTDEDQRSEMFGFFMLSGKATSFLGPLLMAIITSYFNSQRMGMLSSLLLFAVGVLLYARGMESSKV